MKFILNSPDVVNNLIRKLTQLKFDGSMPIFEADVKEYKKNRSIAQNRLMHGWFLQISKERQEAGHKIYTPKVWKEYFKTMFLGEEVIELPNGKFKIQSIRTRDLNTKEMTEFLEKVDHYAGSELEIQLFHPDDYNYAMGIK